MQRLVVKGERCYLAMVFAQQKQIHTTNLIQMGHQSMIQRVKRALMKETSPIKKPPPIEETRHKFCLEAPATIRDELHDILEEYADLFPAQLLKGRPP